MVLQFLKYLFRKENGTETITPYTSLFALFSKYLQNEQSQIYQRVLGCLVICNQHEHLQSTWLPGYGICARQYCSEGNCCCIQLGRRNTRGTRDKVIKSGAEIRIEPRPLILPWQDTTVCSGKHMISGIPWIPRGGQDAGVSLASSARLSPSHSLGTPPGLGAAGRGLCWECLSRCSWLRHRQALSACHSGGRSSVAWSARRHKAELLRPNSLAAPKKWENRTFKR